MLKVIMYHYVRDLPHSRFPRIKGMLVDDFINQVDFLSERYEMVSLESALEYLQGSYSPQRDLCLLTFDDGVKEHYSEVMPILAERKISGIFFVITDCIESHRVVNVHQNHFLMADQPFEKYEQSFLKCLRSVAPDFTFQTDPEIVAKTYRWDAPSVGAFKYMLNFQLTEKVKSKVLDQLFNDHFGDAASFAQELYVSWDEAKQMQKAGMILGGHTHNHNALSSLTSEQQRDDLTQCTKLLQSRTFPQQHWPFSYPYGKKHSFNDETIPMLQSLEYACAFATEIGDNLPGQNKYIINRIDPKDVK